MAWDFKAFVRKFWPILLNPSLAAELVVGRGRRNVDAVAQRHAEVRERRRALCVRGRFNYFLRRATSFRSKRPFST
jgi:hypothetical protein